MQELVVEMPRFLQDLIAQVDHRLAVVHASGEIKGALKADFVAFEGQDVHFCQIAEALVAEQDFDARVAPFKPGGAPFGFGRIDEARLRATRFVHHLEEAFKLLARGLRAEKQGCCSTAGDGHCL